MRCLMIDLYCGLGGWADGALSEGYDVVGFDIERHDYGFGGYPAQLVLQDVLTLHGSQFRDAALIVASPPCFVAETLILTARGLLPIPEVAVGDLVLTHRNRWRRVLRTGNTIAPTVIASGYGAVLEGTAEHPIYARRDIGTRQIWVVGQRWPVYQPKCLEQPEWIPLAESVRCHWASPVAFDALPVPSLPNGLPDTPMFWWMVGRWVGDGWVRRREEPRSGDEVLICCNHEEADELERQLASVAPRHGLRATFGELHWRRSRERTTARFTAASNSLAEWLTMHFGRGAAVKSWPAWVFGMEQSRRQALLDGYVSADGNPDLNGDTPIIKTTTVSKRLAIGTRFLAASLGCVSTVRRHARPPTYEIEGRIVNQRDSWDTRWTPGAEHNRLVKRDGGMQWGIVRNVSEGQTAEVWNIEVEKDNSYVADGVVVHNCQAYSYRAMPWKRAKALPPPDNSLFEACFRIRREAEEASGRNIPLVVENVCGAQKWVGKAQWHYGSYYLWGDVPALMPDTRSGRKVAGFRFDGSGKSFQSAAVKQGGTGAAWFDDTLNQRRKDATKCGGSWFGKGNDCSLMRKNSSKSNARKAASALIAKIPFALSQWIARTYKE